MRGKFWSRMQTDNPRLGAAYAVAAGALFAIMGSLIKLASAQLPNEAIVFLRNLVAVAALLPIFLGRRRVTFRTNRLGLHIMRAAFGVAAMYCFFYALGRLPLADAMLLNFAMPVFIPWIAWLWLAERPRWQVHVATVLGLLGIALIVKPSGAMVSGAGLIGAMAAVFAAVAMVTVRKLSSTEPAPRIVLYFAALALLLSGVPAWFRWEGLGIHAALIMLGVGLCATSGQLCLTRAYALARAAEIGTLVYCTVPFAAALGWLFWGEAMDRGTLLGAICVIGAGALANRWRKS